MATSAVDSETGAHLYDLRIHATNGTALKIGGLVGHECDEMLGQHIAGICDAFFKSFGRYQDHPLRYAVLEQFATSVSDIVSTYGYPWVGNIVHDMIVNHHKTG